MPRSRTWPSARTAVPGTRALISACSAARRSWMDTITGTHGHAEVHQHGLGELQAGLDGFRHRVRGAERVEPRGVPAVPGAGDDQEVRAFGAGGGTSASARARSSMVTTKARASAGRAAQQLRLGDVAVVHRAALARAGPPRGRRRCPAPRRACVASSSAATVCPTRPNPARITAAAGPGALRRQQAGVDWRAGAAGEQGAERGTAAGCRPWSAPPTTKAKPPAPGRAARRLASPG